VSATAPEAEKLPHFVTTEPFEPYKAETLTPAQERFYSASQWQIMWWKFRRHRLALVSGVILLLIYGSTLVSEIIAPYNLDTRNSKSIYAPPQEIHFFDDGKFVGPFVYGYTMQLDLATMKRTYTADPGKVQPLRFLCRGDEYAFWGLVEGSFHLICPAEDGTFFMFGTDRLGRDLFSRIVYGTRI